MLFFEHKRGYRSIRGQVPKNGDHVLTIGTADTKREGRDVTVITYGMMVHDALAVADKLSLEGIEVEVLDLRTLRPLDKAAIFQSVKKTGKVLIAHETNLIGGVGGEIAAIIADECFMYLDAPIKRLGAPDIPTMPFNQKLEDELLPGQRQLEASVRELARF